MEEEKGCDGDANGRRAIHNKVIDDTKIRRRNGTKYDVAMAPKGNKWGTPNKASSLDHQPLK